MSFHAWVFLSELDAPDSEDRPPGNDRHLGRVVAICGHCGEIRHQYVVAGVQRPINLSGVCLAEQAIA